MDPICTLEIEENVCEFLSADKKHCMAKETRCSFCVTEENENKPVKTGEKWFDKFYRGKAL